MSNIKETRCKGYILKSTKNISKDEWYKLCEKITNKFNEYYETSEYNLIPYNDSPKYAGVDGGILFKNFNHSSNTGYKALSIYKYLEDPIKKIKTFLRLCNNLEDKEELICSVDEELHTLFGNNYRVINT